MIAGEVGLEHEFEVLTKLTIEGAISFEESLRLRFAILRHVPVNIVQNIINSADLFNNVESFISRNKERCFIVTGNLDVWIRPLMKRIGCRYFSSTASENNGVLTTLDSILKKSTAIHQLRTQFPDCNIIAFGDGLNDYPMFEAADKAVAIGLTHPPVQKLITKSNYVIFQEASLCRLLNTL